MSDVFVACCDCKEFRVCFNLLFVTQCFIKHRTGMVFVVSFSSCLDVAAISMDMGEALDVNNELMTVGISNCKYSLWSH